MSTTSTRSRRSSSSSTPRCERRTARSGRRSGPETLEVVEIARAARGALHGDEVREPAHAKRDAVELALDRLPRELGVGVLGVDTSDPLHDVEIAKARLEAEVGAGGQVLDARRVIRELVRVEVAELC